MDLVTYFEAALLGLLEGLTEFIPVSSTGHLILAVDLLGFRGPEGKVFEIAIQLGAILAVCWVYRARLWGTARDLPVSREAQLFTRNLALAVVPALVIGVLAYSFIKTVLFSVWVVSLALILGGVAILVIEHLIPVARHVDIAKFPLRTALAIGLFQCVAMIPGVSRSGATIMGALLAGVERRSAAEFSFFLAIPTMVAATGYDLYKNWALLDLSDFGLIATGFLVAFVSAMLVVRTAIAFIGRHGFAPFAWYRIAVGLAMLAILSLR